MIKRILFDLLSVILITALLLPFGKSVETAYAAETKRTETSSYTVKKGDSLWKLSGQYYGKGSYYTEIYRANQDAIGNNPDLIFPGMVFELPVITKDSGTKKGTGSSGKASAGNGTKDTGAKDAGAKNTGPKASDSKDSAGKEAGQKGTDRSSEEDLIGDFLIRYYGALAAGDAGYCLDLYDTISAEDRKLLEAIASYFDQFENLTCRVLDGPLKGSYVAFVDCEAVSLKDGHRLDHMEAFYLVPDSKKEFRIASPEQYFEDVRKNQTP